MFWLFFKAYPFFRILNGITKSTSDVLSFYLACAIGIHAQLWNFFYRKCTLLYEMIIATSELLVLWLSSLYLSPFFLSTSWVQSTGKYRNVQKYKKYLSKRNENINPQKGFYKNVHSSFMCNGQDREQPKDPSSGEQMNKLWHMHWLCSRKI